MIFGQFVLVISDENKDLNVVVLAVLDSSSDSRDEISTEILISVVSSFSSDVENCP